MTAGAGMFFMYEWLMDLNGHIYQDPQCMFPSYPTF